jgi:predicted metal-dependent peptidase
MKLTAEQRIMRSHIQMMKHPETALYSGVFMLGTTEVIDAAVTAYTDGVNKKYGKTFLESLSDMEVSGLVLHENLHIVFRHLLHNRDLFEEDQALANAAADYVVNDVIVNLKDKNLCDLPKGALVDDKYHNKNMREVYRLLKQEKDQRKKQSQGQGQGQGQNGNGASQDPLDGYSFDQHDTKGQAPMNAEEAKALDTKIDRALREGALLAGRLGHKMPRAIKDLLEPKTRWQDELREFMTSTMVGKDEMTWKKFNRRLLPNDIYMPSVENEAVGELILACDTSGSISNEQITEFATEMLSICSTVTPELIRVLWWDTSVHSEQLFRSDKYHALAEMLKPEGGGGTRVGCVAEYVNVRKLRPECVIVFTDGYVEPEVKWDLNVPTLWLVTRNKGWTPPTGRKVVFGD